MVSIITREGNVMVFIKKWKYKKDVRLISKFHNNKIVTKYETVHKLGLILLKVFFT